MMKFTTLSRAKKSYEMIEENFKGEEFSSTRYDEIYKKHKDIFVSLQTLKEYNLIEKTRGELYAFRKTDRRGNESIIGAERFYYSLVPKEKAMEIFSSCAKELREDILEKITNKQEYIAELESDIIILKKQMELL